MESDFLRTAIIDGKEVSYSACSNLRNAYKEQEKKGLYRYIGKGVIHRINNVVQEKPSLPIIKSKLHFWVV